MGPICLPSMAPVFFLQEIPVRVVVCKRSTDRVHHYYHQMLGAAIIHPDLREVIPFMPERL